MLENQENAESKLRSLRRKMRVYPGPSPIAAPRHPEAVQPRQRENGMAENRRYEDARRKAIVSIYGRDLSSEDKLQNDDAEVKDRNEKAA